MPELLNQSGLSIAGPKEALAPEMEWQRAVMAMPSTNDGEVAAVKTEAMPKMRGGPKLEALEICSQICTPRTNEG